MDELSLTSAQLLQHEHATAAAAAAAAATPASPTATPASIDTDTVATPATPTATPADIDDVMCGSDRCVFSRCKPLTPAVSSGQPDSTTVERS